MTGATGGRSTAGATETDREHEEMARAVELAARGAGAVLPNPVVGCVILAADGETVGEGWHQRAGGPHAEVVALRAAGGRARGGTAVVTLEPCNHIGRTGPCSQALIAAGVARVVAGVADPWAPAAGGLATLRAAGIATRLLDPEVEGPLLAAVEDGNRVWLTATRRQRPFVTFKAGMTADGRVAAPDGTSRWITSTASRERVHQLRSRVDTMLVGIGTVLTDDPQLTARDTNEQLAGRQPLRVVVDSRGRTPLTARVLDDSAETLIATAAEFPGQPAGLAERVPVDLQALLDSLYRRGRRHVLLEGGPRLAAAMLDAALVDEILLYIAPLVLGAGRSVLEGGAVPTLSAAHRLELREMTRVGEDVELRYVVPADRPAAHL